MELSDEEKQKIDHELAKEKYRKKAERKYFPTRKIWTFWGSALGIFILSLVFVTYIPSCQERQRELERKKQEELEKQKELARQDSIRNYEEEVRLEKLERVLAEELGELQRELNYRFEPISSINIPANFATANTLERTILGSASITNTYRNTALIEVVRILEEKTRDNSLRELLHEINVHFTENTRLLTSIQSYSYLYASPRPQPL